MTLILSAVAGDYAVQVSDRRLTVGARVEDDETNKAVLFCGRFAFAYTGLAKVAREPTDEWLTRALVNAKTESLSDAVDSLACQATAAFQKIRYSKIEKRHAFVGVGWTRLRNEGFVSPIICSVSNALDGKGNWLNEAKDDFSVNYSIGPGQPCFNVVSAGQALLDKDLSHLRRKIRKCFERKTGPEPIVRYLTEEIHRIANRNPKVGKSLMVVCLPKHTAFVKQMMLTDFAPSAPMSLKETQSFYYVSRLAADKIRFAPNTACGGQGFRSVKMEKFDESGRDGRIEATIVLSKS